MWLLPETMVSKERPVDDVEEDEAGRKQPPEREKKDEIFTQRDLFHFFH